MSGSSIVRPLAALALSTGAVVLPVGAVTASDGSPNKAQIEYEERQAARAETQRSTKAQIEYEERLAQQREQAATTGNPPSVVPTPEAGPSAALLAGLGVTAAAAGGSVLVVRHLRTQPRVG